MTYGETTSDLRTAMVELLRRRRILQPLGGPGIHTVPESTTLDERRVMGEQIQRFRHATLVWCDQATESVSPKFIARVEDRGPAGNLRFQLARAIAHITVPLPSIDELAKPHPNVLVETWRQAAAASVLGEHDFPAGVHHACLDGHQTRAVLKDTADIVRGLVILDRRYANVPGWLHLKNPTRLERAAEACSQFASQEPPDYSVDARGWRPPPAAIAGPARPGLHGVIQAQHNMLVDLSRFPNALNLRRILHSQIGATHEAARHAGSTAPELVERFRDRESTYKLLLRSSRHLAGLVGAGGMAAAESQNAEQRLRCLPNSEAGDAPALHELARMFTRTDARIAATIERGFAENLYFVSLQYPRLGNQQRTGVVQPRERWIPVTSPAQTELLPVSRERLCLVPLRPRDTYDPHERTRAYEQVLNQHSGQQVQRGPGR